MHRGFLAGFSTTFTIMMIQRWWIDYTRSDGGVRKSNTRLPSVSSSNFHETRRCLTVISRLDLPLLEEGEVEATLDWWSFNNTESMLSAFSVTKNEKGDTRSVFFLLTSFSVILRYYSYLNIHNKNSSYKP